ncbi:unnamed protein product [Mytilus coruscus]|uniref:Immunoglobulin domain-containing protein n=1 Tax=Mytilus coruscus TaxID=42192 RepID=A0A6J8AVH5_MYTCO|nr:unnamed protein product [Mytilus coruscus]
MYRHINYNWKKKVKRIYHVNGFSRRLPKRITTLNLSISSYIICKGQNTSISGHGFNITNVYVDMNENIELICDCFHYIQCSWSTPNLKNFNSFIHIDTKSGTYNLKITNVSALDVGSYTCTFWEAGAIPLKLHIYNLQLQRLPSNLMVQGSIMIKGKKVVRGVEGKILKIVCIVESGRPPVETLVLSINGSDITNEGTDRITYSFIPTKQDNMQLFTCSAYSSLLMNPLSSEVRLDIQCK